MTCTLGDLLALEPALDRIGAQTMPAKHRYAVARLIAAVRTETKHFVSERTTLIKSLGTEQPNGDWSVTPEHMKTFIEKAAELAAVEVSIEKWLLTHDILDTVDVSPNDILLLTPLIVAPPDETKGPTP